MNWNRHRRPGIARNGVGMAEFGSRKIASAPSIGMAHLDDQEEADQDDGGEERAPCGQRIPAWQRRHW